MISANGEVDLGNVDLSQMDPEVIRVNYYPLKFPFSFCFICLANVINRKSSKGSTLSCTSSRWRHYEKIIRTSANDEVVGNLLIDDSLFRLEISHRHLFLKLIPRSVDDGDAFANSRNANFFVWISFHGRMMM
jgi:hypothetical protein